MSVNLLQVQAQQFSTNISLLLQQKGSRLRRAVREGAHKGNAAEVVNQLASIEALDVLTRFSPMPRVDANFDIRWVYPKDKELPQLIDTFDKLRLLVDPTSSYVENAVYAMGRSIDRTILSAAIGTNQTGSQGANAIVLPSGQKILSNFGASGAVGLTVAKMKEAKRLLMAADIDMDNDEVYMPVTAKQHDDLLSEAQVISSDFNGGKAVLEEGKIIRFLGVNLIHTELLTLNVSSERIVPMWVKSGMYLGIWGDIYTSITKRNDLSGEPWQAYARETVGATRTEEKRVVTIDCSEA